MGMSKAEYLAAYSEFFNLETRIRPIPYTISDPDCADLMAASDILLSAVDRPPATLGISLVAARFQRPHIDAKSGATYVGKDDVSWGGELRIRIPGTRRCCGCMGEADWEQAIQELSLSEAESMAARRASDPHKERPGTSPMMIDAVASTVQTGFWRFIMGEIRESMWLHLNGNQPKQEWEDWTTKANASTCRCCGPDGIVGLGDLGM